jgi:hypothetical protein
LLGKAGDAVLDVSYQNPVKRFSKIRNSHFRAVGSIDRVSTEEFLFYVDSFTYGYSVIYRLLRTAFHPEIS